MAARRPLLLAALLTLAACKNECQKLCDDIADLAEECGQEFAKDQVKSCYDANKTGDLPEGRAETCEEVRPFLAEEWTCDDVAEYFDAPAGGGGGGGSDTGT